MATATAPTRATLLGTSMPILMTCLVLSVLVHLLMAGGLIEYARSHTVSRIGTAPEITLPDFPTLEQPEENPVQLGRAESRTASVTWLGVIENPVEGQAKQSEVDQAELAINAGDSEIAQSVAIQQQTPVMPSTEPASEPREDTTPTEPKPVSEPVDTSQQAQPETVPQPEQATPVEPTEIVPEPIVEATDAEEAPIVAQPELVQQPEEVEPTPEPVNENEPVTDPDPIVNAQQADEDSPEPEPTSPSVQTPQQDQQASPSEQGKVGEEDERESVASMIKRADTQRAADLNRPLSSSGLEIKPVEPRYPATVRFTQLPRNPIVIIRFNAQGRVVFTDFIRDTEKKRVYDTGSRSVDEPLLSAIYKWRAEGKPLKELDPEDPKSYIEITMKILFRDEDD